MADAGKIKLELRTFSENDLDGKFLAVVATASGSLNELIYREAQRRGVLCNVVDVPEYCDFFYPAVVRRGDLQIAISTTGQSPSLAQKIRQQLERQFGVGYAAWVEQLGATRRLILASDLDKETKLELLHSLASREAFEAALAKIPALSTRVEFGVEHEELSAQSEEHEGKSLSGGRGAGRSELLTVKALRLLRTADAVLHDDLVAPEILKLIPSTAQVHNVGKRCGKKKILQAEINCLMVALAASGLRVVRLKGGDPLIFGRAGEEIESLRRNSIPFEIVPGVTSAMGAAAAAQIPLTHRHASDALVFITAHRAKGCIPRTQTGASLSAAERL